MITCIIYFIIKIMLCICYVNYTLILYIKKIYITQYVLLSIQIKTDFRIKMYI